MENHCLICFEPYGQNPQIYKCNGCVEKFMCQTCTLKLEKCPFCKRKEIHGQKWCIKVDQVDQKILMIQQKIKETKESKNQAVGKRKKKKHWKTVEKEVGILEKEL